MDANELIDTLAVAQLKVTRRPTEQVWLIGGIFLILFMVYALAALLILAVNWTYGDWQWGGTNTPALMLYWLGIGSGVLFFVFLAGMGIWRVAKWRGITTIKARRRYAAQAQAALLAALVAPDDALLPPLPYQPQTPLLMTRRRRVAPLPHLKTAPVGLESWRIFGIISFLFVNTGELTILSVSDAQRGNAQSLADYLSTLAASEQLLKLIFFIIIITLGFNIVSSIGFKDWRIFADTHGVSWYHLGKRIVMPWSEIRTIGICEDEASHSVEARYVIASEHAIITWHYPASQGANTATNGNSNHTATAQLLALAMNQTGLPLRDVQLLAQAIAQQVNETHQTPKTLAQSSRLPRTEPTFADIVGERIIATQLPTQRTPWGTLAIIAVLLLAIMLGPNLLAMYIHDTALPRYIAALPGRIQAKSPLFHDALLSPANGWPLHTSDATDGDTVAYTTGGYTITNGGGTGMATLPTMYHAVAIQVTLRMSGTALAPNAEKGGVGIVIRQGYVSDTFNDSCMLLITMQGQWEDTCGYDDSIPNGYSASIHQGSGAVNTLMVLARGQFVSFFLNGQYMGFDYSTSTDPFGQIGVVNQSEGVTATFTDFTVWAINPPPNPSYI